MEKQTRKLPKYALLAGMLFLSSCFSETELPPLSAERTFGIRHDLTLADYEEIATNNPPYHTSDYPDFSPVVAFTYSLNGSDNHDYVASGVLISPDWVLTAGHNFYISDDQRSPAKVEGIQVIIGNDPNDDRNSRGVAELVFHPTWLEDDDVFGNANDFCLVRLDAPVTDIKPAILLENRTEVIGSDTWSCGFGDYSLLSGQDPDLYSRKHATANTLDRLVSDIPSRSSNGSYVGGLVAVDFDSPAGDSNTLGDDYISPDEPLLGAGISEPLPRDYEGASVEGDSGGPIFSQVDGEWVVIGILSGAAEEPLPGQVDSNYGEIDIYTRVSTSYEWIASVVF